MTVRVVLADAAATTELRRAVLRPQWPAGTPMPGDDEDDALHLAATDGPELVGAGVLLPRPYPEQPQRTGTWQLRGMATAPERRGTGVGSAVLHAVDAEVHARGGTLVWCTARSTARAFYERHGYTVQGSEFLHRESGLPHFVMTREPSVPPTSSSGVGGPVHA